MSKNEMDARRMAEQLKKLPEDVQQRVGYIIQGAMLIAESRAELDLPPAYVRADADRPSA